jgi:hypothetical protein
MEPSPFWETSSHSVSQEIPRLLWNPKAHYRVHKDLQVVPLLRQKHPPSHPLSLTHVQINRHRMKEKTKKEANEDETKHVLIVTYSLLLHTHTHTHEMFFRLIVERADSRVRRHCVAKNYRTASHSTSYVCLLSLSHSAIVHFQLCLHGYQTRLNRS